MYALIARYSGEPIPDNGIVNSKAEDLWVWAHESKCRRVPLIMMHKMGYNFI